MKKLFLMLTMFVVAFMLSTNMTHAYDPSNLTVTNGGLLTYQDPSLVDGWYELDFDGSISNGVGLMDAQYYTGDLSSGTTIGASNYTRSEDYSVTGSFTLEVYVIDGNWKIIATATDTFNTSTVANSITMTLIELNELNPDNLTVSSNTLTYDGSLLDGWYQLDITSITDTPTGLVSDPQYYTGDPFVGETLGTGSNNSNYDVSTANEMHVEIYVSDGQFKIESVNTFDVALSDVTHVNLTLISLDTPPEFNYSEYNLDYDLNNPLSINDIKSLLSASDDQDGDLTSSIQLYSDEITGLDNFDLGTVKQVVFYVEDSDGNTAYVTINCYIYSTYFEFMYTDDYTTWNEEFHFSTDLSVAEVTPNINVPKSLWSYDYLQTIVSNMMINADYVYNDTPGPLDRTDDLFYGVPYLVEWFANEDNFDSIQSGVPVYFDDSTFIELTNQDATETGFSIYITFNIFDDIAPDFTGSTERIVASTATELTTAYLISNYITVSDDTGESITPTIYSNDYSANYDTVGRYEFIVSGEDSSENKSYHTIVIYVVDQSPPMVVADNSLIEIQANQPITEADLEDTLVAYGIVVTELGFTVEVIDDDYFDNSTVPGDYTMHLLITYDDNTTETIELAMHVTDDLGTTGGIIPGTSNTSDFLGLTWYWWVGIGAFAYLLLSNKKFRKGIGMKK